MIVKQLTEHHLEFLSLKVKETAEARQSLHMLKCHIVGNLMSRLNYIHHKKRSEGHLRQEMEN